MELLRAAAEGQYTRVQHLLHIGADIDYRDEKDLTVLHHAVLSGFEDVAELLLRRGADVNAPSRTAGLPLCLAVLKDRSNMVPLLLGKFRAAVNLADPEFGTPLHCAAFTGNCEIARCLLEHRADFDSFDCVDPSKLLAYQRPVFVDTPVAQNLMLNTCWTKATPLMIAIIAKKLALVSLLLEAGCKVDRPSEYGKSEPLLRRPLRVAAWWGLTDVVGLLISFGAELDLGSPGGGIALLVASHRGHADCVKKLIDAGALVDISNGSGDTALIAASTSGHESCVRHLLNAGASLDLYDEDGCTALIMASMHGNYGCVDQLLRAGASMEIAEKDHGSTALHEAVLQGHSRCARMLCEHGADVNFRRLDGSTPLYGAASHAMLEGVQMMLEYQADPNLAHEKGWTPLMAAIEAAKPQSAAVVEALLHAGALVTVRSDSRETALHVAVRVGQKQIAKMLLDAFAAANVICKADDDHVSKPCDRVKPDRSFCAPLQVRATDAAEKIAVKEVQQIDMEMHMERDAEKGQVAWKGWNRRPRKIG